MRIRGEQIKYVNTKETEINFGSLPVADGTFTVSDADVSSSNQITGNVAYAAPTGKDLDEVLMDTFDLKFAAGNGQLTIYARGLEGYVHDKFKINYTIG